MGIIEVITKEKRAEELYRVIESGQASLQETIEAETLLNELAGEGEDASSASNGESRRLTTSVSD